MTTITVILSTLLGACTSVVQEIDPNVPWPDGVTAVAKSIEMHRQDRADTARANGTDVPDIVVIKDRHPLTRRRVSPRQQALHRQHRLLVGYLVANGFDLLGCEAPLGPVEDSDYLAEETARIRRADRDDVRDEHALFQPLRYRLEHGERLTVVGVENPEIFAADIASFRTFLGARRRMARRDITDEERRALAREAVVATRSVSRNVRVRGEAAARNLVAMMGTRHRRAMLMIGARHVPSAVETLQKAGYRVDVFEAEDFEGVDE